MSQASSDLGVASDLSPSELAEGVSNGARLSVYLEPDTDLPGFIVPKGRYLEAYPLPHICIQGDAIVGGTRRTHVMHRLGEPRLQHSAFFYTNVLPIYGIYAHLLEDEAYRTDTMLGNVLNAAQYKVLRFVLRPAGDCVWSDKDPDNTEALVSAIANGHALYTVFTDWNGIRRSHPLDLAFIFPDTKQLEFRVEHALLPEIFTDPKAYADQFRNSIPNFDEVIKNPKMGLKSRFRIYSAFRCIHENGEAYGASDVLGNRRHQCRDVRVFAMP